MAILTIAEAANVLRTSEDDPGMVDLLASVDSYIQNATGHDWSQDDPVLPEAKSAARMLLTMWYENPAMIGTETALSFGLTSVLLQLEALAL